MTQRCCRRPPGFLRSLSQPSTGPCHSAAACVGFSKDDDVLGGAKAPCEQQSPPPGCHGVGFAWVLLALCFMALYQRLDTQVQASQDMLRPRSVMPEGCCGPVGAVPIAPGGSCRWQPLPRDTELLASFHQQHSARTRGECFSLEPAAKSPLSHWCPPQSCVPHLKKRKEKRTPPPCFRGHRLSLLVFQEPRALNSGRFALHVLPLVMALLPGNGESPQGYGRCPVMCL